MKEKIVKKYNINNDITSEYFKIFFEENIEYKDKLKNLSERNPNCHIEELKKIINNKKEKIKDSNINESIFEKADIISSEIIKEKIDNNDENNKPSSNLYVENSKALVIFSGNCPPKYAYFI